MKFVLDENLGPDWLEIFRERDWEATRWIDVGTQGAADEEIFEWAGSNGWIVVTRDLDFGRILYLSRTTRPSVILIRSLEPHAAPNRFDVLFAIERATSALETGALLVIEHEKHRVRVLPLA